MAALDNVHEHQEVGCQPKEHCGDERADNCKERDGPKIAEELALLQREACSEHYRRQQPVEERRG